MPSPNLVPSRSTKLAWISAWSDLPALRSLSGFLTRRAEDLVALTFPASCFLCHQQLESPFRAPLCSLCLDGLPLIAQPSCARCGLPFAQGSAEGLCGPCRFRDRRFRLARASGPYERDLREILLELKFRGRTRLAGVLGKMTYERCIANGDVDPGAAFVAVPLHPARRRERGYNQAELLARVIARCASRPLIDKVLVKVKDRPAQTGLSAAGRFRNAAGAYRVRPSASLRDAHVVLVDDVFTTGATAESCVGHLLRAGCRSVDVLTVARAS